MTTYTVESPGKTYTTEYNTVEEYGSASYRDGLLVAAKVRSEMGNESFALIEIEGGRVVNFENPYDRPCLLAAYHDRIGTGDGQGMIEDALAYLSRIGVSYA